MCSWVTNRCFEQCPLVSKICITWKCLNVTKYIYSSTSLQIPCIKCLPLLTLLPSIRNFNKIPLSLLYIQILIWIQLNLCQTDKRIPDCCFKLRWHNENNTSTEADAALPFCTCCFPPSSHAEAGWQVFCQHEQISSEDSDGAGDGSLVIQISHRALTSTGSSVCSEEHTPDREQIFKTYSKGKTWWHYKVGKKTLLLPLQFELIRLKTITSKVAVHHYSI